MAPPAPKRLLKEVESANELTPTAEVPPGRRVTRSQTGKKDSPAKPQPPKKKAKKGESSSSAARAEDEDAGNVADDAQEENVNVEAQGSETKEDVGGSGSGSKKDEVGGSGSGSKKDNVGGSGSGSKKDNVGGSGSGSKKDDVGAAGSKSKKDKAGASGSGSGSTTVVIERSTICSRFKTRAEKVKEGLEKAIPGINVIINPEKPRKGFFEIRDEAKKEQFISIEDTKRPFKRLEAVDIEQLIADIVAKLQG